MSSSTARSMASSSSAGLRSSCRIPRYPVTRGRSASALYVTIVTRSTSPKGALSLLVGIAGEAAGGEAAGVVAAPVRAAREGADGSVRSDRSGEAADRFAADIG
jgi:hypothetical protein